MEKLGIEIGKEKESSQAIQRVLVLFQIRNMKINNTRLKTVVSEFLETILGIWKQPLKLIQSS